MSRFSHFILFLAINIFEIQCKKIVLRTGDMVVKFLPDVDEEIKELAKVAEEINDLHKGKNAKGSKVLPEADKGMKDLPNVVGVNNLPQVSGINNLPHGNNILPQDQGNNNLPKPVEVIKQVSTDDGNIQMETHISFIQPNVQPKLQTNIIQAIATAPEVLNQEKQPEEKKVKGRKRHRVTKEILRQIGGNTDFIELKKNKIDQMKKNVARIRNQLKARKKDDNHIATNNEKHPIMRTENEDKNSNNLRKKRKHNPKVLRSRFAIETKTEKTSSTITTSYSPVTRKRSSDSDEDEEPVMRGKGRHADDDDLNFDLEGEMLSQIV